MKIYPRIFAAGYDRVLKPSEEAGLREMRRRLLKSAVGNTVEIGAGTGANVGLYPGEVTRLVLTEPSPYMARRLEKRLAGSAKTADGDTPRPTEVVVADAQSLPFDEATFDTAVSTLVLCSVPDPDAVLEEIARVLRPGGRFLFLEHVRGENACLARWQDRLNPLWRRFANGCRCNRTTLDSIARAPFSIGEVERTDAPKSIPLVKPLVIGSARRVAEDA